MISMPIRYGLFTTFVLLPLGAMAQTPADVRSSDQMIMQFIAEGAGRSTTFAHQLERLNRPGVSVRIEWSERLPRTVKAVTVSEPIVMPNGTLYFQIFLSPNWFRGKSNANAVVPTLAHELQHVCEKLGDKATQFQVAARTYETREAQHVEDTVKLELR